MAEGERRDWRELCAAAANETDSEELTSLIEKILCALEERERGATFPAHSSEAAASRDEFAHRRPVKTSTSKMTTTKPKPPLG